MAAVARPGVCENGSGPMSKKLSAVAASVPVLRAAVGTVVRGSSDRSPAIPLDLSLFAPIPLALFIGGGQSHAEQSSDGVGTG
jgi:hypothetical protein